MSLLLRVRKTVTRLLGWIAEIAASQVADRKGNAFIVKKVVKKNAFYYFHCYLSILASLNIEIGQLT